MKRLGAVVMLLASACALAALPPEAGFDGLLSEGELRYDPPAGYVELAGGRNPILDYEHAVRSADGLLEVRLAIRPLQRLRIDYDDPHGSVPDPNHIFPLVFESLASRLAGGRHAPSNAYSPQDARDKFNADWAAAAVFDTVDEFATEYRQGLLIALHRNKVSDAYLVLLFDDYRQVKPRLERAMRTLVFAPRPAGAGNGALPMLESH